MLGSNLAKAYSQDAVDRRTSDQPQFVEIPMESPVVDRVPAIVPCEAGNRCLQDCLAFVWGWGRAAHCGRALSGALVNAEEGKLLPDPAYFLTVSIETSECKANRPS